MSMVQEKCQDILQGMKFLTKIFFNYISCHFSVLGGRDRMVV
jgi:hypothetical protein